MYLFQSFGRWSGSVVVFSGFVVVLRGLLRLFWMSYFCFVRPACLGKVCLIDDELQHMVKSKTLASNEGQHR